MATLREKTIYYLIPETVKKVKTEVIGVETIIDGNEHRVKMNDRKTVAEYSTLSRKEREEIKESANIYI